MLSDIRYIQIYTYRPRNKIMLHFNASPSRKLFLYVSHIIFSSSLPPSCTSSGTQCPATYVCLLQYPGFVMNSLDSNPSSFPLFQILKKVAWSVTLMATTQTGEESPLVPHITQRRFKREAKNLFCKPNSPI